MRESDQEHQWEDDGGAVPPEPDEVPFEVIGLVMYDGETDELEPAVRNEMDAIMAEWFPLEAARRWIAGEI